MANPLACQTALFITICSRIQNLSEFWALKVFVDQKSSLQCRADSKDWKILFYKRLQTWSVSAVNTDNIFNRKICSFHAGKGFRGVLKLVALGR